MEANNSKQSVRYHVLCFKGYQSAGAREAILFGKDLDEKTIPHLIERIPKEFVDDCVSKYLKEPMMDNGYCTLGLILRADYFEKAKCILNSSGKKEKEDFIVCEVEKGDKKLETLIKHWDAAYNETEVTLVVEMIRGEGISIEPYR